MSIDLTSESGAMLNPSGSVWCFYLRLAEAYGWIPAGSLPPEGMGLEQWTGAYDSSDGQRVTREDAAAMADALERVLADPAKEATERVVSRRINEDTRSLAKARYGVDLSPADDDNYVASSSDIEALVTFLRAGAFRVE